MKKAKAKDENSGSQPQSDEDILKARALVAQFERSDLYLWFAGYGLWGLAALWFLNFPKSARPQLGAIGEGYIPAELVLPAFGIFCSAVSKGSPRGTWSLWRKPWLMLFVPLFGFVSVGFLRLALSSSKAIMSQNSALFCVATFAIAAVMGYMTVPKTATVGPAKTSSSVIGRLIVVGDGLIGIAMAAQCMSLVGLGGLKHDGLKPPEFIGIVVTIIPLGIWGFGMLCCRSDAELIVAVNVAMLFSVVSMINAFFVHDSIAMVGGFCATFILHSTLYLPFPMSDPLSNPFYCALRKQGRQLYKIISSPSSGFGDSAEDG